MVAANTAAWAALTARRTDSAAQAPSPISAARRDTALRVARSGASTAAGAASTAASSATSAAVRWSGVTPVSSTSPRRVVRRGPPVGTQDEPLTPDLPPLLRALQQPGPQPLGQGRDELVGPAPLLRDPRGDVGEQLVLGGVVTEEDHLGPARLRAHDVDALRERQVEEQRAGEGVVELGAV